MRGLIIIVILTFLKGISFCQQSVGLDSIQRFYYPDGQLSSEGIIRNGQPDGYWKSFYENGQLKSEGNRKQFELDSIWKFYNPAGKLILEITYQNGRKNGFKTYYLDTETIRENYVEDIKEGFTCYYQPDGRLTSDIPFVKGLEQGIGKDYGTDGGVITITEYKKGFIVDRMKINRKDKNNLKQGRWIIFWTNGKIKEEGVYKNSKKNGYFKEYSEKGELIKISKYNDDKLIPEAAEIQKPEIRKEYYDDGKIKSVALFRNGVLDGVSSEFSPDGQCVHAVEFHSGIKYGEGLVLEDGSRDGHWKEYYPDGSLKAEGNYEAGKPVGPWKYNHENGKTEQSGTYNKKGNPEGTWKWYYENGQLLREENYYRGEKDGLSEEFDEKGNLIERGEYLNGLEEGPWMLVLGDHLQRGSYRDGLRTGIWVSYLLENTNQVTDSVLIFKGAFIDDLPDGKHLYYWENGKIRDEGSYVMGKKEGDWIKYNADGTVFIIITYRDGIETRYDGVKIKPPFESE